MLWFLFLQFPASSWWSFFHWTFKEHWKRSSSGLLSRPECKYIFLHTHTHIEALHKPCLSIHFDNSSPFSVGADLSRGDRVLYWIHQDQAHRVRSVRPLPAAPAPFSWPGPDQVGSTDSTEMLYYHIWIVCWLQLALYECMSSVIVS